VVLPVGAAHCRYHPRGNGVARSGRGHGQEIELLAEGVVAVTTTYEVRAKHWSGGWELHIGQIGVTQVRTLDKAEQQVRDYLETLLDINVSDVVVVIHPDLGGLEKLVRVAQEKSRAAEVAQRNAAQEVRQVAERLRESGLSVSDTAAVMGVSRGRVSQIVKPRTQARPAA
jgi:hypothetical protein